MIASELEAALRRDLRDEATWTVYADWLASQGDSRGELIGYEQRAERETDPALVRQWRARAKQLFERDHPRWLGPLRAASMDPVWTRGFVTEAVIHNRPRWTAQTLLRSRTGALIYRMGFTRLPDCQPVADALADSWIDVVELRDLDTRSIAPLAAIRGLRELFIERCELDDLAALAELPLLERLVVHDSRLDLRAFEHGFVALRHLVLADLGWRPELEHVPLDGLGKLPALEVLDLHDSRVFQLDPLAGLGKLRQLDISRTHVRSLTPLECVPMLERVDAYDISPRLPRSEIERLAERGVRVELQPPTHRYGP